jgi:hypothetical protein
LALPEPFDVAVTVAQPVGFAYGVFIMVKYI